jgi:hypothetical protein
MEKATLRLDENNPSASALRDCFAEIFRSLDACPRKLTVNVVIRNNKKSDAFVDFDSRRRIIFKIGESDSVMADFRCRWLPEHEVPLHIKQSGITLFFKPTGANRVKVDVTRSFISKYF